jgi:hypothetical protein
MRKIILLAFMICGAAAAFAQADATTADQPATADAASADMPVASAEASPPVEDSATTEDTPAAASEEPAAELSPPPDADTPVAADVDAADPAADASAAAGDTAGSDAATDAAEEPTAAAAEPQDEAAILAEIERLSAKLEEANGVIDELRSESYDLKNKAAEAEAKAVAAQEAADAADAAATNSESKAAAAVAINEATEAQLKAAEDAAARAEALAADAQKLKAKVAELEANIAALESGRDKLYGKLASFGSLKIDSSAFPELLRSGFADSKTRLGTWKEASGLLSQTDKKQYFSRLTFPLVQSTKPILYSFETKTGSKGWVGTGIHLFAEGVKKPKGYGEGKSLLVWLTRDAKVRGNDGTYLQVYRSDSDISMERVLDAKIKERLDGWNKVEVLYEPAEEFIVLAVNGTVRAAYRTYFGIGAGVSMSLRTLGEGVQFRNLQVRR